MKDSYAGYPSDLNDSDWEFVARLIPASKPVGADRTISMRAVVNAVFYRERSGCPWRMLPHDFPNWRTVYGYFRQWKADGTWECIHRGLHQRARGESPSPESPAISEMAGRVHRRCHDEPLTTGHSGANTEDFSKKLSPASESL